MIKVSPALLLIAVASLSAASGPVFAAENTANAAPVVAAPQTISIGRMVFAANNQRLGAVYHVSGDAVQVIVDGKMINLPASTISVAENGKYVTTLTKADVLRAR